MGFKRFSRMNDEQLLAYLKNTMDKLENLPTEQALDAFNAVRGEYRYALAEMNARALGITRQESLKRLIATEKKVEALAGEAVKRIFGHDNPPLH